MESKVLAHWIIFSTASSTNPNTVNIAVLLRSSSYSPTPTHTNTHTRPKHYMCTGWPKYMTFPKLGQKTGRLYFKLEPTSLSIVWTPCKFHIKCVPLTFGVQPLRTEPRVCKKTKHRHVNALIMLVSSNKLFFSFAQQAQKQEVRVFFFKVSTTELLLRCPVFIIY